MLLKNCKILKNTKFEKVDILIKDDKIEKISENINVTDENTIDVRISGPGRFQRRKRIARLERRQRRQAARAFSARHAHDGSSCSCTPKRPARQSSKKC